MQLSMQLPVLETHVHFIRLTLRTYRMCSSNKVEVLLKHVCTLRMCVSSCVEWYSKDM